MEAGSMDAHAMRGAEALLEELKRHNEEMLRTHKQQLEAQYQEQLAKLLAQFRPPPIQTKIAINSAAADERNAKVVQRASEGYNLAPQISIYDGGSKTQVLRMAAEKRGPESVVVDGRTAHFADDASPRAHAASSGIASVGGPPIHPSLRNSIYGKGSLLPKPDKSDKKKAAAARAGGEANPAKTHSFKETAPLEVTAEEAEDMAAAGKLDGQTSYMLKKTAFLINDSSRTISEVEARKKAKARRRRRKPRESSGDYGEGEDFEDFEGDETGAWQPQQQQQQGRSILNSAGFSALFQGSTPAGQGSDLGEGQDEYVEEEDLRESLSRARDNMSREAPIEDFARAVRSGQGSGGDRLPPVDRPSSSSSSGSGNASGGVVRVVEFNDSLPRLPVLADANDQSQEQQGADWDLNRRVNNHEYSIDPHLINSKTEWENEIARHVLSVYATAKISERPQSPQQQHESAYVIDFVDIEREDDRGTVQAYVLSDDGLGPNSPLGRDRSSAGMEWDDYISEEEGAAGGGAGYTQPQSHPLAPRAPAPAHLSGAADGVSLAGTVSSVDDDEARDTFDPAGLPSSLPALARGRTKKNKARRAAASAADPSPLRPASKPGTAQSAASHASDSSWGDFPSDRRQSTADAAKDRAERAGRDKPPGTLTAAEAGLLYEYEESFRKTSKFRTVTLVTNPAGEEVALRGSPRCFPIWFTSTGDVYAVWSRLPGGDKLQAHLSDLYERRLFKEYLGFIERIIDDLWRERKLGKIDLEGFGNKRASTRKRVEMAPGVIAHPSVAHRALARPPSENPHPYLTGGPAPEPSLASSGRLAGKPAFVPTHDEEDAASIWTRQKNEDAARKADDERIKDHELVELWGQLILTANAVGILCIEKKKPDMGLEILTTAEKWAGRSDILPKGQRNTLRAHVHDSLAFFFYKKGKAMSAASYTALALEVHERDVNVEAVGASLLHSSALQCQLGDFKAAHRTLYTFLQMVEDGRLSFQEATPKQLCLVAVAYHNLAVVQLKLLVPDLACKSSANARKIARLCLSYSNRWMHVFQWTHDLALEDVRFQLTAKPGIPLTHKQLQVIKTLTMAMYSDDTHTVT